MNNKNFENRTILFALRNGNENLKSCQFLAESLREKGYRIVFSIEKTSKKLIESTFEEEVFTREPISDTTKQISKLDLNCLNALPIEVIKNFGFVNVVEKFEFVKQLEDYNQKLVERIKPDIIIIEALVCSPALTNSGIPWVWLNFGPPNLCKTDNRIPPGWSGLSKNKPNDWISFVENWNQIFKDLKLTINSWCVSKGTADLPNITFHPHSPYLNAYVYPKELDYKMANTWELKNWQQFDCLLKKENSKFVLPDQLMAKPGKLIYVSMGLFASADVMKRLIEILAKSKNRFIVSKGPFHKEYELEDNMWGLEDIPLLDVINSVDLVICSGDNDIIAETFFYSKQIIILPLFGDQLDNRTRLKELGFGWGLDPFNCSHETLLSMVDSMANDVYMNKRLAKISYDLQQSNACKQLALEIEKIMRTSVTVTETKSEKIVENSILGNVED